MTDNEINIAIAEACGWRSPEKLTESWWAGMSANEKNGRCEYCGCHFCDCTDSPPSYTTDLNAMHEAEMVWTADQWYKYDSLMPLRDPQKIHATARQRAEAFLRTLDKWKD